jgi:tetratricopeptide (TPR) repeat protein
MELLCGNLQSAEAALDDASSISRGNEVRQLLPPIKCGLGNLYLQTGRLAEARSTLLEAKKEAEAAGNEASILLASTYLSSAYGQLGDTAGGLSLARACQASARQKGYQGIEAMALFAEAANLSHQGALEDAIAQLERAVEIATRLEARPLLGLAKGTLARLFANSGRKAEAREELAQAIALFSESKMTIQLERAKGILSKFSDL